MSDFLLSRNESGRLVLTLPNGQVHVGVVPVRAFPMHAPEQFLAFMSTEGKEVVWVDDLTLLPQETLALIAEEIASREMMPVIQRIFTVSTLSTPSTWEIMTDRGATKLVLKGEEDIRRIGESALIIADTHGIQFLIRDLKQLDKHSRKLLDRFL